MAVSRVPECRTRLGLIDVTDAPIGIFDSGVGGLTVARAIKDQLPNESILYIGDTAHSPYGPKKIADVREYALEVLDDLVSQDVKLLVIACNTASAAVLRDARERYSVPVIEVIQPAVRRAVGTTRNKRVGVVGTAGTVNSRAYNDAFAAATDIQLFSQACPRFVEFVESGVTTGDEVLAAAHEYLEPLLAEGLDTLVLGCTHYPLLAGAIGYVAGPDVRLVSSAEETAADVYRILSDRRMLAEPGATPAYEFEATTEAQEPFLRLARRFLGPEVTHVEFHQTGVIQLPGRTD